MRKKIILILFIMFLGIKGVYAECDSKARLDLNTAAANVKTTYEVNAIVLDDDGNVHPEVSADDALALGELSPYIVANYFTVNVTNVADNIYVTMENIDDNIFQTIYSSDLKNGVYTYEQHDVNKIKTFNFKIYSNNDQCPDEELGSKTVITPMYNDISDTELCTYENHKDKFYCQVYVTSPVDVDVAALMVEEREKVTQSGNTSVSAEDNFNFTPLVVGVCSGLALVILIVLIIVIIRRRRRSTL